MQSNDKINEILTNPKKSIRKFSATIMFSMAFLFVYGLVDTIFVSGLGVDAIAAVGFFAPVYMFIIAIGQGIGTGMSTAMSRNIGANNTRRASDVAIHTFAVILVIAVCFVILNFSGLRQIMTVIGASQVIDLTMAYGSIHFIFAFIFLIEIILSSLLRAEGDMKRSTMLMAIGCILNATMDPILIYYFNMGISGAAISSVTASLISTVIAAYWIFIKKDTHVKIQFRHFRFSKAILYEVLNVGIPATLEGLTMDVSTVVLNYILMVLGGSVAVAVFTAGFQVVTIAMIPAMAVEGAILTVAGMIFGSNNLENIKVIYDYAVKFSTVICILLAVIIFVFSNDIALLFSSSGNDLNLINGISEFIRILVFGIITIPMGICATAMFQAKGKGFTSLFLVLLRDILLVVAFALIFGFTLNMGVFGVFLGISLGYVISGVISYLSFKVYYNKL